MLHDENEPRLVTQNRKKKVKYAMKKMNIDCLTRGLAFGRCGYASGGGITQLSPLK